MTATSVKLSRTGDEMPLLGLGTYKSANDLVGNAVEVAVRNGCRLVDCAAMYNNEVVVGEALKHAFDAGVVTLQNCSLYPNFGMLPMTPKTWKLPVVRLLRIFKLIIWICI